MVFLTIINKEAINILETLELTLRNTSMERLLAPA